MCRYGIMVQVYKLTIKNNFNYIFMVFSFNVMLILNTSSI